jgi:protein disulfide-isomerase A1
MEKVLLLTLFLINSSKGMADWGYPETKDVVILQRHNHDQFIRDFELKVVQYSSPSCKHCNEFDHSYSKLALYFKDHKSRIPFAKVDCSENEEFCKDHLIPVYPFIKLFIRKHAISYYGPRTEAGLKKFIKTVLLRTPKRVQSLDELQLLTSKVQKGKKYLKILYFGRIDEKGYHFFDLACKSNEKLICRYTSDKNLATQAGLHDNLRLIAFKTKGKKTFYRPKKISFELLEEFFFDLLHKKVHEIGPVFRRKVIDGGSDSLILFVKQLDDPIVKKYEKTVRSIRNKLPCFIASPDSGDQEIVVSLMKVMNIVTFPTIVLAQHIHDLTFIRFVYKYQLEKTHLNQFLQNVWQKKLLPDLISEAIPDAAPGPIRVSIKLNI